MQDRDDRRQRTGTSTGGTGATRTGAWATGGTGTGAKGARASGARASGARASGARASGARASSAGTGTEPRAYERGRDAVEQDDVGLLAADAGHQGPPGQQGQREPRRRQRPEVDSCVVCGGPVGDPAVIEITPGHRVRVADCDERDGERHASGAR
ncbi:hypothetical protein Vau01_032580 [Virgisporangium aurantiacum]|uniref:Uncharacterized protein n=1 Tax=Virgisporangium aurantiacum TaxID=175570 RepID=A0A8J3Z2Z7_9ACTN|nr:hypothetical protein Vau01_032580 [Virgisporangium aurantiacum]